MDEASAFYPEHRRSLLSTSRRTLCKMDGTSSQGLPSSWSLESAYKALNIRDPAASDGNVVVGFHQRYSTLAPSARTKLIGALELISFRRQSRLLAFVLTIIPHLTKDNVALLATPPAPSAALLPNKQQQPSGTANSSRVIVPATAAQQSNAPAVTANSVVPTMTASSSTDDLSGISVDDISVPSEENYSTCFYYSSSEVNDDSTDYESEESMDGRFWNGQTWRCDQCFNEIVEGKCPLGHNLNPCKVCEEDPEDCTCDKSQSTSDDEEDLAGDDNIVWDDHDGIWRCTACLWEVEANSEDNGECHCVSKPNVKCFSPLRTK